MKTQHFVRTRRFRLGALVLALVGAGMGGYYARTAFAAGIPSTNVFTYSGILTDDAGAPLTGKVVTVALFDAATAGTQKCGGSTAGQSGVDGRFSVPLDPTCLAAIQANPNLFVEVSVQGSPVGRTQIGAVPYAASSDVAAQLTGSVSATQVTGSLPATQVSSQGTTVEQRLADVAARVPAGSILAYAGLTNPVGYLPCDGAAVSRTTYAALFAAIGTTYGAGNGSTTFNVPNAQGVFLRGEGTQTISGTAYTGVKGTSQTDQFRSHNHGGGSHSHTAGAIDISGGSYNPNGAYDGRVAGAPNLSNTVSPSGTIINTEGGPETRPANIVVTYYIRI